MAETFTIYKMCEKCKGTGIITIDNQSYDKGPPEEIDCPRCEGAGKLIWGEMREEE